MENEKTGRGINREILKLSVPAVASNIAVPLLGLCDTFITGHLGAPVFLAAISVGTIMVNSTYWLFSFLRAGTSGLTARAFGKGDIPMQRHILTMSLILALAIGTAIITLSYPISSLLLMFADAPGQTASLARQYFLISTLSAPALLATMSVSGWMIGKQNTLYPMVIAIGVNALNILLSFSFVYGCGLGFKGVALGTMTANWAGVGAALLLAKRLQSGRLLSPLKGLLKEVDVRKFFAVNIELMLRSGCIIAVTFGMTAFSSRVGGNPALAVNAVMMQLFLFFSFFMDGFAYAGEAICGKWSGADDAIMLRRSVKWLAIWGVATTAVFALSYSSGAGVIAGFLTDEQSVVADIRNLSWVCACIPLCSGAAFLLEGVYIGLTATRKMLAATFTAAIVFYAVAEIAWLGLPAHGFTILWGGFLLFLTTRSIILSLWLPSTLRD